MGPKCLLPASCLPPRVPEVATNRAGEELGLKLYPAAGPAFLTAEVAARGASECCCGYGVEAAF